MPRSTRAPRGAPGSREPLTRGRVIGAAIVIADEEGLSAVTMRRVAEALGVVPMALYKHVADKEDLVEGMVDALVDAFPTPPCEGRGQWRTALRDSAIGARAVVSRHPWARRAIETRSVRTPAVLAHMERTSQVLLRAGFTPDLTHHVMHLLGNRIWGFSPELFTADGQSATGVVSSRAPRRDPDPSDYPGIVAIAADARSRRPDADKCDEDFEFAFALDVLLDGIARLKRSGWASGQSVGTSG